MGTYEKPEVTTSTEAELTTSVEAVAVPTGQVP